MRKLDLFGTSRWKGKCEVRGGELGIDVQRCEVIIADVGRPVWAFTIVLDTVDQVVRTYVIGICEYGKLGVFC